VKAFTLRAIFWGIIAAATPRQTAALMGIGMNAPWLTAAALPGETAGLASARGLR
jgi:hypothetical protein